MQQKNEEFDEDMFQFPHSLPNDLENFCLYYPKKFPKIIEVYKELAKKYFKKPVEFKKFIYEQQKELLAGFDKIKKDYDNQKNHTEEFLVDIDQRLHKLFCFRFWIVNYGFADGPAHDYYVEKIRYYSEMIAEWETIEEKEAAVLDFERALLQGDYADLYLQGAFQGIKIYDALNKSKLFSKQIDALKKAIEKDELNKCYSVIEEIIKIINKNKSKDAKDVLELLSHSMVMAKIRGDNLATYNAIIHAFEFREKSLELLKRYEHIKQKIMGILKIAEKKLSKEQYEEMKVCYEMSNLLKEAKDVYGELDPVLLPFWFGLLGKLAAMLKVTPDRPGDPFGIGHSSMFYFLVWHVSDKMKAKIFTPDTTDFDLKKL